METARENKRIYTRRTKEERLARLKATLERLETFHARQAQRIEQLKVRITLAA